MNWTGGRLRRHSGNAKTTSLSSRQKQHFAKVQHGLSHGHNGRSPKTINSGRPVHTRHSVAHLVGSQRSHTSRIPSLVKLGDVNGHIDNDVHRPCSTVGQRLRSIAVPESRPHQEDPSQITLVYDRVPEDDIYNATPQHRAVKIKREVPHENREPAIRNIVAEKRRRLLDKGDWVGVKVQRPIRLKFTPSKSSEDIARRRRMSDGHKARYSTKQQVDSLIGRAKSTRHHQPIHPNSITPVRNNVRISIGGRDVQPGASSSSKLSKVCHNRAVPESSMDSSMTFSSDVMLLDNKGSLQGNQGDQDGRLHHKVRSVHSEHESHSPVTAGSSSCAESEVVEERMLDNNQYTNDQSSRSSWLGSIKPARESPRLPRRTRRISSSLELRHPVPRRISHLVSSSSLEDTCSITAQIGVANPVVPSSQVLGHEIWKTWMESPSLDKQVDYRDIEGQSSVHQRTVSISPGISMVPPFSFNLHHNCPQTRGASAGRSRQSLEIMQPMQSVQSPVQFPHMYNNIEPPSIGRLSKQLSIPLGHATTITVKATPPATISKVVKAPKIDKHSDTAEKIWKSFVFDGDDESSNAPSPKQEDEKVVGDGEISSTRMRRLKSDLESIMADCGSATNTTSLETSHATAIASSMSVAGRESLPSRRSSSVDHANSKPSNQFSSDYLLASTHNSTQLSASTKSK